MNLPIGLLFAAEGGMKLTYVWEKATPEAKVIIFVLAVFSIFAWSVMASKAVQMRRAKRLNHYFDSEFRGQATVFGIFDRRLPVDGCPLFAVYQDGCTDLDARLRQTDGSRKVNASVKTMEHVKRSLEGAVSREALKLESGLVLLAAAVSGAPFLGLLGTVWGVMDAAIKKLQDTLQTMIDVVVENDIALHSLIQNLCSIYGRRVFIEHGNDEGDE